MRYWWIWLVGCLIAFAPVARAEPSTAKLHFQRGVELFNGDRIADALREFEESYRLNPLPGVLHNIALSQRRLGRYREAIETFERYLAEASARGDSVMPARRADVERMIAEMRDQLAEAVREAVADAPPVASPTSSLRPERRGSPVSAKPPLSAPRPSVVAASMERPSYALPIAVGATSVTMLGISAALGLWSFDTRDRYDRTCDLGMCDASLYRRGRSLAIASDALFGAGLIGSAATTWLVITRRRAAPSLPGVVGANFVTGGATVTVSGRF